MTSPQEKTPQTKTPLTIIEGIESEFDLESNMYCCGQPAEQKQIDYQITVQKRTFKIPQVWASVCAKCGNEYFDPAIGDKIMDIIFVVNHPKEAQLGTLMGDPPPPIIEWDFSRSEDGTIIAQEIIVREIKPEENSLSTS